jgi:hypothetical protein
MARISIGSGGAAICIVNTGNVRRGFSIQNVSAADIFYSDDQRLLDSVDKTNLATAGHLLAANQITPLIYPFFVGKLFARSQGVGAQLEVILYEVDPKCE